MSDFYDHTGFPSTGSAGLSASMRAEFAKLETAFGKFPALSGNDGKALVVTGGGSSVGVTSGTLTLAGSFIKAASHSLTLTTTATTSVTLPTTGTLATLAGSETFTNKTLTSPIFGGTSASGVLQGSQTIVSSATSGFAFGGAVASNAAMLFSFIKVGPGSSTVYGLLSASSLTGGVSDVIQGYGFALTAVKAASGTHANIDTVFIGAPNISGSATTTTSSSLRIAGASSSGATNLYAFKVDAGTSRFDGLVDLGAGQVKFPATQNPSADVNTLDDYEEGTWTPSLGGSATYTSRVGTYTKIGRQVTIHCILTVNTIGTGSTLQISGLPFTAGVNNYTGACSFSGIATSVVFVMCQIQTGTAVVIFPLLTAAGTSTGSFPVFQNGTAVTLSITYNV